MSISEAEISKLCKGPTVMQIPLLDRYTVEDTQNPIAFAGDDSESRLYVGNLDRRVTEASLIKLFSPFGKIVSENFLWHTSGPKRGVPRGFAFIQFSTRVEAELAKEKMNGRLACGRPLVVRLASEKYQSEIIESSCKRSGEDTGRGLAGSGNSSRNAKMAAIKNKLKDIEEKRCNDLKKHKGI